MNDYQRFLDLRRRMITISVNNPGREMHDGMVSISVSCPGPDELDCDCTISTRFGGRWWHWGGSLPGDAMDHWEVAIEEWEAEYGR